jgi:hypothetical protein
MDAVAWVLLFLLVLVGAPWVAALWLLWQARPARGRWAALDGPGRLLALAVAALPEHRGDWGRAMTAELDQLPSLAERWRFALGGLRVALLPPQANRRLTLGMAAAAVVVAPGAHLMVGRSLPGMRVFAFTFVAVVGVVATLAVARSGRLRLGRAGVALTVLVPVAVGGAIGMAVYFLRAYPSADRAAGPGAEVLLALVLSVVIGLVLATPRALVPGRLATGFGIGGGLALGLLLGLDTPLTPNGGKFAYMIFGPMIVAGPCGALTAALGRSFRSGVQATVWTLAVGAPVSFIAGIPAAIGAFDAGRGLLMDGEGGVPIGTNLPDLILYLAWILLAGLPCGVIGTALGASLRPATT